MSKENLNVWRLCSVVFLACVLAGYSLGVGEAQPTTKTFTCEWTHDGLLTDGYRVLVDGVSAPVTPVCTGTGAARLCTTPLTMTLNVPHVVRVEAYNLFGSATSLPFSAAPPATVPAAVVVK